MVHPLTRSPSKTQSKAYSRTTPTRSAWMDRLTRLGLPRPRWRCLNANESTLKIATSRWTFNSVKSYSFTWRNTRHRWSTLRSPRCAKLSRSGKRTRESTQHTKRRSKSATRLSLRQISWHATSSWQMTWKMRARRSMNLRRTTFLVTSQLEASKF